jgi:hypothetical protein
MVCSTRLNSNHCQAPFKQSKASQHLIIAEHCYRNIGTTPSRHWIITMPAGFETFFAESAQEFAKTGGPDMELIVDIHREHGIELLDLDKP